MRAFISYSHDSKEHAQWVVEFAGKIQQLGVEIVLDKWHLKFGQDVGRFMEESVASSDVVLVICTPNYVRRSNGRRGGVGYESVIFSSELSRNQDSRKFVPIVRCIDEGIPPLPIFFGDRLYVDMSEGDGYGVDYAKLTHQIIGPLHGSLERASDLPLTPHSQRIVVDGPTWFDGTPAMLPAILDLLGINDYGLVNVDLDDIRALFGTAGFWYASASTACEIADYAYLASISALQIGASGSIAPSSVRSLCIAISGPSSIFSLEDTSLAINRFRSVISDDTSVIYTALLREAGARISIAFA